METKNKKHLNKVVNKQDSREILKRWNLLRDQISNKWDNKLSGIEEIREQRNKRE